MRLNQLLPAAMFLAILTAQWGTPGGYRSHPGHGPAKRTANRTSHITQRAARRYTHPPPASISRNGPDPPATIPQKDPGNNPGVLPHEEPE